MENEVLLCVTFFSLFKRLFLQHFDPRTAAAAAAAAAQHSRWHSIRANADNNSNKREHQADRSVSPCIPCFSLCVFVHSFLPRLLTLRFSLPIFVLSLHRDADYDYDCKTVGALVCALLQLSFCSWSPLSLSAFLSLCARAASIDSCILQPDISFPMNILPSLPNEILAGFKCVCMAA